MRAIDNLIAKSYRRRIRGTRRLADVLYAGRPYRSVPASLNGLRWEADPLSWMDQQVLKYGTYEPKITEGLLSVLRPGDTFWDVGANAGFHALLVKAARPDVQVVAFEPAPAQYERLRRNAAANGLQILAYCVALAESRGYRSLSVVDVGNSGLNSLRPRPQFQYSSSFPCWCDTGDDLVLAGVPSPTVMKVDVEGAEEAVFAGMSLLLGNFDLRHVFFEGYGGPSSALLKTGFKVEPFESGSHDGNWSATRNTAQPCRS